MDFMSKFIIWKILREHFLKHIDKLFNQNEIKNQQNAKTT